MKRRLKHIISNDVNTRISYTGHKLNNRFQLKEKTAQIHESDLVSYVKCPDHLCNQDYLGKAGRRTTEPIAYRNGKD